MPYTIGIGALLDRQAFNTIRSIELQLAAETGNFQSLGQAPNVTIKRPFEVASIKEVQAVIDIVDKVAAQGSPFEVSLGGHDSFNDQVIYMNAHDGDKLMSLHHDLMSGLYLLKVAPDPFEGEELVFHTTLADGLSQKEFQAAEAFIDSLMPHHRVTSHVTELGLFLQIDGAAHWPVVKRFQLG